jgi:hypothetical protein
VQVHFGEEGQAGGRTATAHMVFKPTLWDRLRGKRDVIITKRLDGAALFGRSDEKKNPAEDDDSKVKKKRGKKLFF